MVLEFLRVYPRAFKVLFVSALIENTAFGLIIPVLTLYMLNEIGISEVLVGIVLMAYTVSGIPAMIFGGVLADKIGRRVVLLASVGLMAVTMFAYSLAAGFYSLLVIALADSFVGSMYMPAANAMIADVIPSPDRPKAFSILRIGWNVGIVIGPVIGMALVLVYDMKVLFWFGAIILASAFVMNMIFVPETKPKDTGETITFRKVVAVGRDKPFFLLCGLTGIFFFYFAQWISVLPVYAVDILKIKDYLYYLLFTISSLMVVFLQVWVTSRTEKLRRSSVLMAGQVLAAAGFALIFLAWDFVSLLACIMIITGGEIVFMSIVGALVADMAPESRRGIYMGFSGFVQTLGNGLGFLFGMWMLAMLPQPAVIWLMFGGLGFVTAFGYIPFRRMIGPAKDRPYGQGQPDKSTEVALSEASK